MAATKYLPKEQKRIMPDKIREMRAKLEMTQLEFATAFWCSDRTVRQWESGERSAKGPAALLLTTRYPILRKIVKDQK